MLGYIFPLISLIFLSFNDIFSRRVSTPLKYFFLLFITVYMIIFGGIRYYIGTDYGTYYEIFSYTNSINSYSYLEPGFRLAIILLKKIGISSPEYMFLFFSLLVMFPVFIVIKKYSYSPFLSLYIYLTVFYLGTVFNILRQGIVMSIFLISLKYICEDKLSRVLALTVLAISIHYSGIFITLSYLFSKLKFSKKKYRSFFFISVLFILFNSFFANFLIQMLPEIVSNKLVSYSQNFKTSVGIMNTVQRLLLLCPFLIYFDNLKKIDKSFEVLFKIYFLGFLLYALFSFQGLYATRINMFFRVLEIFLVPYFFKLDFQPKQKKIVYAIIIFWGMLIYMSLFFSEPYFPYVTYFDG